MMRIRKVRVAVAHGQMAMNVLVRHTRHDRASLLMLMVRIVNVLMRVFQGLMRMLVSMQKFRHSANLWCACGWPQSQTLRARV